MAKHENNLVMTINSKNNFWIGCKGCYYKTELQFRTMIIYCLVAINNDLNVYK